MIFDDEALSFRIMGVIKVDHEKGYFEVEGRPYAALSYRVSGVGFFESEGERICSCAGDLLYVPAGSAYNVEYSGGEMIVVHFFDCSYNVLENITVLDKQRLKEIFIKLYILWEEKHAQNAVKARLFDLFQDLADGKYGIVIDDVVAKASEYINENISNPEFSICELCTLLHVSGATLRRKFEKSYGLSPKEYLIKQRMNKAFYQLASGNYSVREVCADCGFDDDKYFSRIIKAHFGKTPSQISKASYI